MARLGKISVLLLLASGLGLAASGATIRAEAALEPKARGLTLAQARCSSCHSVLSNGVSPNPEAPSLEEIANRPGVTRATLRDFLRDSHNYPAAMGFKLEAAQVAELSDYVLTLQRPGYRPIM